jgi:hypothetical protein
MVCTLGVVIMCPTITNEKVNLYRKDGLSVPFNNSNTTTTILRTETIYRGGLKGSPFLFEEFCVGTRSLQEHCLAVLHICIIFEMVLYEIGNYSILGNPWWKHWGFFIYGSAS